MSSIEELRKKAQAKLVAVQSGKSGSESSGSPSESSSPEKKDVESSKKSPSKKISEKCRFQTDCQDEAIGFIKAEFMGTEKVAICFNHLKQLKKFVEGEVLKLEEIQFEEIPSDKLEEVFPELKGKTTPIKQPESPESPLIKQPKEELLPKPETPSEKKGEFVNEDELEQFAIRIFETMKVIQPQLDFSWNDAELTSQGAIYREIFPNSPNEDHVINDRKIAEAVQFLLSNKYIILINLKEDPYSTNNNRKWIRKYCGLLGVSTRPFIYYAKKEQFEADFNRADREDMLIVETKAKKEITTTIEKSEANELKREAKIDEKPKTYVDCRKFPSLKGIYGGFKDCQNFFRYRNVYINDHLLRKILLSMERDRPLNFKGEPGDGKSLTAETFLDWVTLKKEIKTKIDGKSVIIKGYNNGLNKYVTEEHRKNNWGFAWESLNVGPETNPTTLFGGYAPESIGGGQESAKNRVIEWGKISECIREGKYVLLDELNRGDNEVFARLMGALASPYRYEVPEARTIFTFKRPKERDAEWKRSNFIMLSTMNTGDVGNFQMGFAFRRRFKIADIHYEPDEAVSIFDSILSYQQSKTIPYSIASIDEIPNEKLEIIVAYGECCNGRLTGDAFFNHCVNFVHKTTKAIFETTHKWADDKVTHFGSGIAQIENVLADISLYIQDIILRVYGDKKASDLLHKDIIDELDESIVEILNENVISSLVDLNDLYKMRMVAEKLPEIALVIKASLNEVLTAITENLSSAERNKKLYDEDNPENSSKISNLLSKIFKFDASVEEIRSIYLTSSKYERKN